MMNPDVNELIQSILQQPEPEKNEVFIDTPEPETGRDFQQFQSKIASLSYSYSPSQVERWVLEYGHPDWLVRIQEKWRQCETRIPALKHSFLRFFSPLLQVVGSLSQQMQPAPVYRNAVLLEKPIYEHRRRAIAPADLPVIHPLFCTALNPVAGPIRLEGLTGDQSYTFHFRCIQNPEWQKTVPVVASKKGEIEIDMVEILRRLESAMSCNCELVWYLEENNMERENRNWMSGLVWLQTQPSFKDIEEISRILLPVSSEQRDETWMNTLIQVNLSTVQELYTQAYETARRSLIFTPKSALFGTGIPLKECLWQFIEWVVGKMVMKVQSAEKAFQNIQPDWNGVTLLLVLKERIAARD